MRSATVALTLTFTLLASIGARAQDHFVAVSLDGVLASVREGAPEAWVPIADAGTDFVRALVMESATSGWFVSTFTQSGTQTGFYRFADGVTTRIADFPLPSNGSHADAAWTPGFGYFLFTYSPSGSGASVIYRVGFDGNFTALFPCVLPSGQPARLSTIALEPGTGRLFGYHRGPAAALVVIDMQTGVATPIAPSNVPDYPAAVFTGMDFSPCGKLILSLNFGQTFQVDVETGQVADAALLLQLPFPISALAYVHDAPPTIGAEYCDANANSTTMPAALCVLGSEQVADDELFLWADHMPPGQSTLFFFGPNAVQLPFANGFRCVGGGVHRVAAPALSNPAGTAAQRVFLRLPPANGRIVPGSTWRFQAWYRDTLGVGSNLTDGVAVDFR